MRNRFSFVSIALLAAATAYVLLPTPSLHASSVDLALDANNISFSTDTLYVGDSIRLYARVRNVGDVDATAYVLFYQGGMVIGQSQPVSLRASGNPDDVFVDFTVPDGTFNIRAVLQGSAPQDTNPGNDSAITPLFTPIADTDRDGVTDETDNCVHNANADQLDTDHDGIGNVCDSDDDGDGVSDTSDTAPLDATVSEAPAPKVVAAPVPVVAASPTSAATTSSSSASTAQAAEQTSAPRTNANTGTGTDSSAATSTETPSANAESVVGATSTSKLTTSPLARFTSKQIDWRTYEFTLAEQPADGVRFSWDFGDGATSVQPQITHAFSGPGTYTVTLAIVNADGTTLSDAQTYDVSFFHLDNPQVLLLIGALIAALFLFGFAFIKLRRTYD